MKKTKTQNGITLVALIITIVILLILAAVSIASIQDSHIISYANNAAQQYKDKQKEEISFLEEYENILNNLTGNGNNEGENGDDNNGDNNDGDDGDNNNDDTITHTHTYDNGVQTKAATCLSTGITTYTCTYSGCNHTTTTSIAALGHKYVNQVSSVYLKSAATYSSPAIYYKSCIRCSSFGNGGTFTHGSPLSGGNTIGGGGSGDSGYVCTNHIWQISENEDYICPHAHLAKYECTNTGCDATKEEKEGHWPRANTVWDSYFLCGCARYIDFPNISSFDTSNEWHTFRTNGMTGDERGTWIWNNVWSKKCNCN